MGHLPAHLRAARSVIDPTGRSRRCRHPQAASCRRVPSNAGYKRRPSGPHFTDRQLPKVFGVASNYPLRCPRSGRSPSSRITGTAITRKMKPPWARRHWGGLGHGNRQVAIDRRDDQCPSPLHRSVEQQFERQSAFSATFSEPGGSYYVGVGASAIATTLFTEAFAVSAQSGDFITPSIARATVSPQSPRWRNGWAASAGLEGGRRPGPWRRGWWPGRRRGCRRQ